MIPLYQIPWVLAYPDTLRNVVPSPTTSSGTRRTGGSTASPRGGDRRRAPRRLGRGRRGTQQTPKRGGTLVVGRPSARGAAVPQPVRRPCAVRASRLEGSTRSSPGAFEVGPDRRSAATSSPVQTIGSRKPRSRSTYHIRPEARWSDGVPVTAPDFVFTHGRSASIATRVWSSGYANVRQASGRSTRRPFGSCCARRSPAWRYSLHPGPPASCAREARTSTKVWIDRIDNPKTGKPIGSGPFLVGAWERGKQLTLVRNPRYWGAARCLPRPPRAALRGARRTRGGAAAKR